MRLHQSLSVPCIIVSLLGCGPDQPTIEPAASTGVSDISEPALAEPEAEPKVEAEPEAKPPEGCQVQLLIAADGANGKLTGPVTLRASAKNLTDTPLELTLRDTCPGGEAHFSGLEPADGYYDYYATCNKGMCQGGRPPKVIALSPGAIVDISNADIHPQGKQPCKDPIAAGTYKLTFSLTPEGANNPVLCGPEPLELTR